MNELLVASDSATAVDMIRRVLRQEGMESEGCTDPLRLAAEFERVQPRVLVLGFKEMEAAERHYLSLYRQSPLVASLPHRTLLLCPIDQTRAAYERCRTGAFDDYVPFWPMAHDGWMLPKAVHLALRAIDAPRQSAALLQVAAQARRIAELEGLLDAQVAEGLLRTEALARAGDAARAGVGTAMQGLRQRIVEEGLDIGVQVLDAAKVQQALDHVEQQALHPALDRMALAIEPVRQWVGRLKAELAAPVEAARAVVRQAPALRPKVLVVDDDRFVSRTVQQVLSQAGYEVQGATDAAQGLRAMQQGSLDLVLLDVGLPDLGGIELLRRIKAHPSMGAVPVVMLTGRSEKETIVESMGAGASGFIVKPFTREGLLAKVERVMEARAAGR